MHAKYVLKSENQKKKKKTIYKREKNEINDENIYE